MISVDFVIWSSKMLNEICSNVKLLNYLCRNSSPVEVQLGVGELVARVDGQGLGVEAVRVAPLAGLEGGVAFLLLLTQELGFLKG